MRDNDTLRHTGVRCLGLYCLLDVKVAKECVPLFISIIKNDQPDIALIAISALFDFMIYFGPTMFQGTSDNPSFGILHFIMENFLA